MGHPDLPQTWDERKKVLVQYIVYPNVGDWKVVRRKDLIPYHGGTDSKKKKGGSCRG